METNLCVAGFGGQGVMTLGKFLADATCNSTDKNVTFFPSYGAEQRGGTANCFVVISDEAIGAPLGDVMDDLIVMNGPSLKKFIGTLKSGGTLFINSSIVSDDIGRDDVKLVKAPVTELALEMGNAKVLNLASNYASLFTYLSSGLVVFPVGIPCAISNIVGNIIGSHFALRKGAKFIRPMMLVVLVLLLGKLITDML